MLISVSPTRAIPLMNFRVRSNVSGGGDPIDLIGMAATSATLLTMKPTLWPRRLVMMRRSTQDQSDVPGRQRG